MSFSAHSTKPTTNENLTQQLSLQIFQLSSLLNKPDLSFDEFNIKSKQALELLHKVLDSDTNQTVKRKLSNDLNLILNKFKQNQQQRKQSIVNIIAHPQENIEETTPLLKYDNRLESQIQINETIILERELDLVNLEQSIAEVNEIFRDLGTLVNEQQFLLGNHFDR